MLCKKGHEFVANAEGRCRACRAEKERNRRRAKGILPRSKVPAEIRFLRRVCKTDSGCWLWKGYVTHEGYGRFEKTAAHRFSYTFFVGGIPSGMEIDHTCNVRACVNPQHLEAVTQAENIRRAVERGSFNKDHYQRIGRAKAAKTHCPKGHPYSGDNLRVDSHNGGRRCKICDREKSRKYQLKRKLNDC